MRFAEFASRYLITIGGIGTILAVAMIFLFLVGVVVPLFRGASMDGAEEAEIERLASEPLHVAVDEYKSMAAILLRDGTVRVHRLDTGEELQRLQPFGGAGGGAGADERTLTALSVSPEGDDVAFGFSDGKLHLGRFGFTSAFPTDEETPDVARDLGPGAIAVHAGKIYVLTTEGKLRSQSFTLEIGAPIESQANAAIRLIAHTSDDATAVLAGFTDAGRIFYTKTRERTNLLTGKTTYASDDYELPLRSEDAAPAFLHLNGGGDSVFLAWANGKVVRYDVRDPSAPLVAEELDILADPAAELTVFEPMLGQATFIVGDSRGGLRAWFTARVDGAPTTDGVQLLLAHELATEGSAVTSIGASPRTRLIASGHADGGARLWHVTTNRLLATSPGPEGEPIEAIVLVAKEDGVVAATRVGLLHWAIDPRYPEASLAALFRPVWYEGFPAPTHTWQAESGTDEFEPKLGFLPLVFGTIKATFYSMLFGTPLALLAAVFTSEFLDRRLRIPIKSSIEMMASLPSVVLGFLAALVIAPFAQRIIPATLAVFVTLPFALLLGAYLWQLMPSNRAVRWAGWQRLVSIGVTLPIGVALALWVGPVMERLFFAGDMRLWLDGQIGTATGGWMLLLIPLSALLALGFGVRVLAPFVRRRSSAWTRSQCARYDLAKFLIGSLLTVAIALALSAGLDVAGFDPRGSVFDTYVQRNALIVGFVMGFAVIPIIYTLAEDALTSVPEHLRLASLGAGATPWQTAVRIIIPTAMSGLFSAVMIGLGRAVGETMIVLMATGNTPVMEWNVFNGFRTLSANIAVELPEAVQGSTHYRALFLAALVLFAMTFVLNTVAEIVRLRFRKRAYQL